ncbi:PulJ/GspJ family protein [Psychrobacter sp. I-STPA10]|uniref:PulJ/GspJ family protein n=1 Tax=Psychrobacter sp. I-STPA10 TaxID=2585769 RepID=UPI001E59EBFB|nr:type II secretion system protein GspJ [Psychrobacter sp. I-STPA10]
MTHLPLASPSYDQRGFTLLELMVAMTIFAILAVAGWQVFDGLNRSKDRAQLQTTALSELQFAYLQIQKDMAQAIPYQLDSGLSEAASPSSLNGLANGQGAIQGAIDVGHTNGFTLAADSISFIRFADPDPRYQSSPLLERIVYRVEGNQLIRQRFDSLNTADTQTPLQSILISDISQLRFQALNPEPMATFPDPSVTEDSGLPSANSEDAEKKNAANKGSLPKGIMIEYGYQMGAQQVPISWQFALQSTPPVVDVIAKPKPDPDPKPES